MGASWASEMTSYTEPVEKSDDPPHRVLLDEKEEDGGVKASELQSFSFSAQLREG